jgi:hypothetical protein
VNREKLANVVQNREVETRRSCWLEGGGRETPFGSMEEQLHNWVKDKNRKGLKVKDQYIKQKALTLRQQMIQEQNEVESETNDKERRLPTEFVASTGWIARFKDRHNLVSRRRTTNRVLLDDVDE